MRGTALRLKAQELLRGAQRPNDYKRALRELVQLICADERRKVTPEMREQILLAAKGGKRLGELEHRFKLSAPTIRKILKEAL